MKKNPPLVRAVVFDMDGTMFNTEDIYDRSGSELLGRRGMEFTKELKLRMMGLQTRKAIEVMRDACGLDDSVDDLLEESDSIFLNLLTQHIAKMRGLDELLLELERRELPKAVATSSVRKLAEVALGHFDLIPRFEFVLTSESVVKGKPEPDIYLLAAEKLGLEPANILVLEDSHIGSFAAAAAKTITVAVPNQHTACQDFAHADHVVDGLDSEVILELLNTYSVPTK